MTYLILKKSAAALSDLYTPFEKIPSSVKWAVFIGSFAISKSLPFCLAALYGTGALIHSYMNPSAPLPSVKQPSAKQNPSHSPIQGATEAKRNEKTTNPSALCKRRTFEDFLPS